MARACSISCDGQLPTGAFSLGGIEKNNSNIHKLRSYSTPTLEVNKPQEAFKLWQQKLHKIQRQLQVKFRPPEGSSTRSRKL